VAGRCVRRWFYDGQPGCFEVIACPHAVADRAAQGEQPGELPLTEWKGRQRAGSAAKRVRLVMVATAESVFAPHADDDSRRTATCWD
jgi:hypothetical protein